MFKINVSTCAGSDGRRNHKKRCLCSKHPPDFALNPEEIWQPDHLPVTDI